MANEKMLAEVQAKSADIIKAVNALPKGSILGVDELTDVVNLVFDGCEIIEKSSSGEAQNFLTIFSALGPAMIPAFMGIQQVGAEAQDLQDEEILTLVDLGDGHQLGVNALKYKQVVKALLFAVQTYFTFSTPAVQ